ncbi:MAG: trypsin-like serine protease [Ardenticatenaceae bacterium]|nr:trypsin-like serine protease [Ardenticatenaceae bacterium]MCB9442703.1 trypsin-like serine protease [Ardenticatenaceae bacterium]
MKRITWIVFLLVLLSVVTIVPASAITWGELDTTHHYVGAMVVDWPDYGPWQLCSGTLVHPQVFVTASHCTYDLADYGIETVWVNFDPYALNEATLRPVAEVITHPEYAWGGPDPHDIALLILAEPVTDIVPAQLPDPNFLDQLKADGLLRTKSSGVLFTLVGYGGTLQWPPPEISYDDYRRVGYSEYKSLEPVWLHMAQNINQGNGGTCFGDSGGPAFWVNEDGSEVLLGVTSWGDAQCVATSFNYRVDLPASLDFIYAAIDSLP